MEFEKRQGIVVYLHSLKQARQLRKYGNIHYISKRLKYVVLYTSMDEMTQTIEKLNTLSYVKSAIPSYKPFIRTEFEKSKVENEREYDKHYGI